MIESIAKLEAVYRTIPGRLELLEWFGKVPTFHDGEIVALHLNRRAPSFLKIYGWVSDGTTDEKGYFNLLKKSVTSFELNEIVFLQLEGFSHQNVIGDLDIRRAPMNPELSLYYDFAATDDDFQIHIGP